MIRSLVPFGRRDLQDAFLSLQRDMNRLVEGAFEGHALPGIDGKFLTPSIDVKESDKGFEVEAELPGVDEKDVQVTFDDGVLTIKGEKKTEKEETKGGYRMSERSYGSFMRALELTGVDADKISASCTKGVLKVSLPKLAGAQSNSKKIEVKAAK